MKIKHILEVLKTGDVLYNWHLERHFGRDVSPLYFSLTSHAVNSDSEYKYITNEGKITKYTYWNPTEEINHKNSETFLKCNTDFSSTGGVTCVRNQRDSLNVPHCTTHEPGLGADCGEVMIQN